MFNNSIILKKMLFFALFLPAVIAYFPSMNADFFADDYVYNFSASPLSFSDIFLSSNHMYAYRPIERLILTLIQHTFGLTTWPIHIICLFFHIAISAGILWWMRSIGYSKVSSGIAAAVFLLAQINALAVTNPDTLSQITATGTSYLSLLFFIRYLQGDSVFYKNLNYYISIIFTFIALLCKETGLCLVPMLFFLSIINVRKAKFKGLVQYLPGWIPVFLLAIIYMYGRKMMHLPTAALGDERLQIHLGFNILKNFLMFIWGSIIPQSSVTVYFDVVNRNIPGLIGITLFTTIFFLVVLRGLLHSNRKSLLAAVFLLLPLSLFPVIFLNGVSELYTYNLMPLISILIGIGIGHQIEHVRSGLWKSFILLLLIIFLGWNGISTFSKSSMIYRNGIAATKIINQIDSFYSQIPQHGNLILVNPDFSKKTEYSIFKRTGFRVLENGFDELYRRAKRDDFEVSIITRNNIDTVHTQCALCLGLQDTLVFKIDK